MSRRRWFDYVVMGASYPSEPVVLEELERVLDAAQPSNVDTERSEAIDGSFVIAYSLSFLGDIEIEVHEDWADLRSVVFDRQIRAAEVGPLWTQETARTVDQIIRGRYSIKRTRWRNKIINTEVTGEGYTRTIATAWNRIPVPDRFLTHERLELDYGCIPTGEVI